MNLRNSVCIFSFISTPPYELFLSALWNLSKIERFSQKSLCQHVMFLKIKRELYLITLLRAEPLLSTLNSCLILFKNDLLKVAYKSYQIIGIIIFTVQKRGICLHKTHSYEYKKKDALTHNNKLDKFWYTIWYLSSFKYHSNLLLMSSMSFRCSQ